MTTKQWIWISLSSLFVGCVCGLLYFYFFTNRISWIPVASESMFTACLVGDFYLLISKEIKAIYLLVANGVGFAPVFVVGTIYYLIDKSYYNFDQPTYSFTVGLLVFSSAYMLFTWYEVSKEFKVIDNGVSN
jgi:hypothetical protein